MPSLAALAKGLRKRQQIKQGTHAPWSSVSSLASSGTSTPQASSPASFITAPATATAAPEPLLKKVKAEDGVDLKVEEFTVTSKEEARTILARFTNYDSSSLATLTAIGQNDVDSSSHASTPGSISGVMPGTQLWSILKYLESTRLPTRLEDLSIHLSLPNLPYDEHIIQALKVHPRIKYRRNDVTGTDLFEHKPEFDIASKDDLSTLLRVRAEHSPEDGGAIPCKALAASWAGAMAAVDELEKEGKVILFKGGKDRYVYANLHPIYRIDQEFQTLWHDLKVPLSIEAIRDELDKASMQRVDVVGAPESTNRRLVRPKEKKKRAPGARRLQFVNTHIEGLDLRKVLQGICL